jgi:hypothetical protein
MGEVERGDLDQLALGADPLEEHDELQLEEDDRVDGGASSLSVQLPRPVADKREAERRVDVPVEVVGGNEVLERDGNGFVEAARFCGAEHGSSEASVGLGTVWSLPRGGRSMTPISTPRGGYRNHTSLFVVGTCCVIPRRRTLDSSMQEPDKPQGPILRSGA